MKKILYSLLFAATAGVVFSACNNGDYNANPDSAGNNSINPLQPLDSAQLAAFVTAGTPSFIKCTINGSPFSSNDSGTLWALDTAGTNVMTGITGKSGKVVALLLKNVYAGNIYNMGSKIKSTFALTADLDTLYRELHVHYSYFGNSGEVQILENDATAIRGTFYFQAIDSLGDVQNVSDGYFWIKKD